MKNLYFPSIALLVLVYICSCTADKAKNLEDIKAEIVKAENDFTEMAQKEGIAKAFLEFAADDAVLSRNDSLIIGKKAIRAHFTAQASDEGQLVWAPDFVDVAKSGDLAYTYGKYSYSTIDSVGNSVKASGVFHTVWKIQDDGSWKFVWD